MTTHRSHPSSSLASEGVHALPTRRRDAHIHPQQAKKREDALLGGVLAAGVALLLTVSLAL